MPPDPFNKGVIVKNRIFVGALWGDESKGASVEYAAWKSNAEWVVRFSGGANAGHNLVTPFFQHTACQIGSGILVGAKTFLSKHFRVSPVFMVEEFSKLMKVGIDPYKTLYMDRECLITTPYHTAFSRMNAPIHNRGTTGMGVGATARYAEKYPDDAIYAFDLNDRKTLTDKLKLMGARYAEAASSDPFIATIPDPINDIATLLINVAQRVSIVSQDEWKGLSANSNVVYEGSQGYWLDVNKGTFPNVTSSNVTYENALSVVGDEPFEKWLCLRIYATRHGVGRFPTHDMELDYALPELHNESTHRYQGAFRRGWLDIGTLKQTVDGLGGVDYLSISHLDYWDNISTEWKLFDGDEIVFSTKNTDYYLSFISDYLKVKIGMLAYGSSKEKREWTL